MNRHDVPSDLQHEFQPDTDRENCSCGHAARLHHSRCLGHHMSGGLAGMVQQCHCTSYQPRSEWIAERGWVLCAGVNGCAAIVFDGGTLCRSCQALAADCARDAQAEVTS